MVDQGSSPEIVGFDENLNPIVSGDEQAEAGSGQGTTAGADKPEGASAEEFFPREKVRPGDEAQWESMQADYTRKTQALAKERKELETIRRKAQIFDELSQDDNFSQVVAAFRDGKLTLDQVNAAQKALVQEAEAELEDLPPAELAHKYAELEKRLNALSESTRQAQQLQEARDFAAKHPDWQKYTAGMAQFLKAGHSYEESYKLSRYQELENELAKRDKEAEGAKGKRREAIAVEPGGTTRGVQAMPRAETVAEAANRAAAALAAQGIKIPL